jgi:hypothetical protein
MATILAPAESLVRVHGRGLFLSILEKEVILTRVKVFDDGRFITETKDWSSYWKPLYELGHKEAEDSLDALHSVWRDYLRSGFSLLLRREFCFRYFSLLDVLLSSYRDAIVPHLWVHTLQTALGFECFGIVSMASDLEVLGAGTCTLRNPCYLLAKLKMPDVVDDPQFLPIITVAGTAKPELFYHYRQYTLSPDSPIALLFYPAVSEAKRSASFRLINSLAGGVSYGIDPRTHERAQRLCHGIVHPIMEANKLTEPRTISLEFVDVGAGSGSLASAICHQVQEIGAAMGFNPKFRLWFVDLELADPARFFRAKKFRGFVDSLTFLGDDYRNWLSKPQPLPATKALRIALVSRLFNNLSRFFIHCFSKEDLLPLLDKMAVSPDFSRHLPSICLASGGSGGESLAISNARVALQEGRTFAQLSLSEFYRGLYLISASNGSVANPTERTFLPVRAFNPECLITLDGKSAISRLAEKCDYVIIEDADLRPQDLIDHIIRFSLHSIVVRDMTKALGLTGNHAYVVWFRTGAEEPVLSGEQIW